MWSNATPATRNQVPRLPRKVKPMPLAPHLPRKVKVNAKRGSMLLLPSATPATQSAAATTAANGNQAHHQSQASAISATPATLSEGRCRQVPRLPRKVKVDVAKCHACHATCRGNHGGKRDQARHQSQPSAISATPATQSEGRCRQVPCLPRKVKVDVTKCRGCHAKWSRCDQVERLPRKVTGSTLATQSDGRCHQAPRLPQSAAATTAANGNQAGHQSQPSAICATPATQSEGRCRQVPRLPCKVTVDVTKCHACHAKLRSMWPSATPATNVAATTAANGNQARHQSQPSAISATPATQSEGRCRQVPRLPRKVKVDVTKRHGCHAKWRSMWPSATPAMRN